VRSMAAITNIFFATDVHGSEKCWRKCVSAGIFYGANVVILGGDLTGKAIVPIVSQPDGTFTSDFLGTTWTLKSEREVNEHKQHVIDSGFYVHETTTDEMKRLQEDGGRVEEIFENAVKERLTRWIELAEQNLKGKNITFVVAPGNDDQFFIDSIIEESNVVVLAEGKVLRLDDDHEMISSGWSNPTPWHTSRECSEEELEEKIEAMVSNVNGIENCIFSLHVPPYDSSIDMAPRLDKNMRPSSSGEREPVGSAAVRKMIEKYQPLLGLHGHIHESRGVRKLGRTMCINPGSSYTEGILTGALISVDKGGFKNYMFTSG